VPRTLLLADDSVTIQRVIELTFADEDILVVAVGDGDQAIERLETAPPDIVLADVGMPGMNGYEVARHIKTTPKLAHIPVVLLTGAFEPVDRNKAAAVGCDGVLAKPFEPQIVIGRVKELLAKTRDVDIAATSTPAVVPPTAVEPPEPELDVGSGDRIEQLQVATGDMDEYFDRLDAAFASLTDLPAETKPVPVTNREEAPGPPARGASPFDWYGGGATDSAPSNERLRASPPAPIVKPADLSVSVEADAIASFDLEAAPATSPTRPTAAPIAAPVATPVSAPPPAEPVAAAEVELDVPARTPSVARPAPPPRSASFDLDAALDEVTERVLARLSNHVGRDMVAEVVANVAERLVREEIDRIKASIK
jgi:CheY-like chemotaxis protein